MVDGDEEVAEDGDDRYYQTKKDLYFGINFVMGLVTMIIIV